MLLFESAGWLFESYLVLFKSLLDFKKNNVKVTCLQYKPACKEY